MKRNSLPNEWTNQLKKYSPSTLALGIPSRELMSAPINNFKTYNAASSLQPVRLDSSFDLKQNDCASSFTPLLKCSKKGLNNEMLMHAFAQSISRPTLYPVDESALTMNSQLGYSQFSIQPTAVGDEYTFQEQLRQIYSIRQATSSSYQNSYFAAASAAASDFAPFSINQENNLMTVNVNEKVAKFSDKNLISSFPQIFSPNSTTIVQTSPLFLPSTFSAPAPSFFKTKNFCNEVHSKFWSMNLQQSLMTPFAIASNVSEKNKKHSLNKINWNNDDDFRNQKVRRNRTAFTELQLQHLEHCFQTCHYPDITVRERLANFLSLPEAKIQVWLKNRRAKHRKHLRNLPLVEETLDDTSDSEPKKNCCQKLKTSKNTIITWNPALTAVANLYPMLTNGFITSSS